MKYDSWQPMEDRDILRIDLMLGNRCNYSCSYCHPWNHSGDLDWIDVDKFLNVVEAIKLNFKHKKQFNYTLSGGEPTMMPRLLELVHGIKNAHAHCEIEILTNGARTERYWHQMSTVVDRVGCSVHVGLADPQQIVKNMKILAENNIFVLMSIMMDVNKWQECVTVANWLRENASTHVLLASPLEVVLGSQHLQAYQDEQLEWMVQFNNDTTGRLPSMPVNTGRFGLHNSTNNTWLEFPNISAMKAEKFHNFKDWYCWINRENIKIDPLGNISSGSTCDLGRKIGNFYNTDPLIMEWSLDCVKCTYDYCPCGSDIQTRKYKSLEQSEHDWLNTVSLIAR